MSRTPRKILRVLERELVGVRVELTDASLLAQQCACSPLFRTWCVCVLTPLPQAAHVRAHCSPLFRTRQVCVRFGASLFAQLPVLWAQLHAPLAAATPLATDW